jgi:hypothetical protein
MAGWRTGVGKTERKQAGVRDEFQEAGKLVVTYPKPPKRQAVLSPQFKLEWSVPSPTATGSSTSAHSSYQLPIKCQAMC